MFGEVILIIKFYVKVSSRYVYTWLNSSFNTYRENMISLFEIISPKKDLL